MAGWSLSRRRARSIHTNSKDLLHIMQLSDSFFPTGMYTMSNGLETLFHEGKVRNAKELRRLIQCCITMQIGVADCVALGNAMDAATKHDIKSVIAVDQALYAMKLTKEVREASVRSGTQLLSCASIFVKNNLLNRYRTAIKNQRANGIYPVVLGVVASICGISKLDAAKILLYTTSISFVGSALRLGIIDHNEGQAIIHSLKPTIVIASENVNKSLTEMWQFLPALDIAQMAHERAENRMFLT